MSGNNIKQLEKELKKCKVGQWILFGTIVMILLVFFSLPLLKLFQPKKITIVNQNGEKYNFSIPSDWVYWKEDRKNYIFFNIWTKESVLWPTFWGKAKNVEKNYLKKYKKLNSFFIKRELNGFNFWEIKLNPNFIKDDGEVIVVPALNCFIYYPDDLDKKEQILKKFLSHWKKVE